MYYKKDDLNLSKFEKGIIIVSAIFLIGILLYNGVM